MAYRNSLKLILVLCPLIVCACLFSDKLTGNPNRQGELALTITIKEAYQGVRNGNVGSLPPLEDSAYVTVEVCLENRSPTGQAVHWENVFLTTKNDGRIFPVALGYDQAEAFDWALPLVEPIGGKRIEHSFFFFPVKNDELLRIPAYQSQGCSDSAQFKSLALLFIPGEDMPGRQYTLHFLEESIPFSTAKLFLTGYVKLGVGLGVFFTVVTVIILMARNRKRSPGEGKNEQE